MESITLDLFLNHLRNAVVIAQADGKILFKNAVFSTFLTREKFSGSADSLFNLFHDHPEILEALHKVIELRGSYYLRDLVLFKGGKNGPMDVELFPLIGGDGQFLAVSILFRDRSGLVRFEEQERRMDRRHYLDALSSGLAHEIKNPLSGIKGASQMLKKELKEEEWIALADIIQKEATRVDRLLTGLLDFSKPKILDTKVVNLNQVLNDLIVLQKTVAAERIHYIAEFDPSLPPVQADEAAVSQVFLNLVKNARQSIEKEGKIILRSRMVTDFGVRTRDKKRQLIAVEIEDTGSGIPAENLPKIFFPFYTTKTGGTGLGLPLCQKIVEEHEGDIQVKSEVGKGTVFTVYLPV